MQSVNDLYLKADGSSTEKTSVHIHSSQTKQFVEKIIPQGDRSEISGELRKRFGLQHSKKKKKQRKFANKKNKLSYKEATALHLRKLPKTGNKYTQFIPLHDLWCSYITSYINLDDIRNGAGVSGQGTLMLQKADFHGAIIKVVRSKCSSLVGTKGIILMDTKGTFQIICHDNSVKIIPKVSSVFEVHIGDVTMTIFGKHFVLKPAERSTKKVKTRLIKDLI